MEPKVRASSVRAVLSDNPRDAHLLRILDATKLLIERTGSVEQVTIRGIAAEAGVAPATLYNRFGGKETIISLAVIDHYERRVKRGFMGNDSTGCSFDALGSGLKMLAETCRASPAFAKVLMGLYFSSAGMEGTPRTMYQEFKGSLCDVVIKMHNCGDVVDWVSPEILASQLSHSCFMAVYRWSNFSVLNNALEDLMDYFVFSAILGYSQYSQKERIEQRLKELIQDLSGFSQFL